MKNWLTLLCALALCLCLAACTQAPALSTADTSASTPEPSDTTQTADLQIPVLSLEGDISDMQSKDDIRNIRIQYQDATGSFEAYATLKVQGTSSLAYVKKNYNITLYRDASYHHPLAVDMGWGAQSKYCLKANWIDRTHARNVVTAQLARQIQDKYGILTQAPCNGLIDGFPIEIYANGQFLGLYTWNIPKDSWQFAMDKDDPDHIVLCGEGWSEATRFYAEPNFEAWSVEVGEATPEMLKKVKALFSFVQESSDQAFVEHFNDHMDLDAALNYYILCEFAYLPDNIGKNMLLVTYDGKKWYPSLYDLDTSWGANYNGLELWDYENNLPQMQTNLLFTRMTALFPQALAERYFQLRQDGILTKEHVMDLFYQFRAQIPDSTFEKERTRWGTGDDGVVYPLRGYDYEQIEHYLDTIIPRLDQKYSEMLSSQPSEG